MFTAYTTGNTFQRATCMFFAVLIVSTSLSLGALAAQSAASKVDVDYSVTVTQLA